MKKNRKHTEKIKGAVMAEEEKKENIEEEKAAAEEKAEETAQTAEGEDKDAQIAALNSKVKELAEELLSVKDKALRDAAEMENYKKRLRADKESAVKFANEALIKDLLDPLDNFSRAIEAAEQTKDFDKMREGVVMVEDQIHSILKNNWGLEVYSPEGEEFNPSDMEACMMKEMDGIDKDTVLQVFMKGYKLHGKVIREAKVMVGKPKSN